MSFLPYDDETASGWSWSLGLSAVVHVGIGFLLLTSSLPFASRPADIPDDEEEFTIVSIDVLKPVQVLEPEDISALDQNLDDTPELSPESSASLLPEDAVADLQEDLVEQDIPEVLEPELAEVAPVQEPEGLPDDMVPEIFDDLAALKDAEAVEPDLIEEVTLAPESIEPDSVATITEDIVADTVESLLATKPQTLSVIEETGPEEITADTIENLLDAKSETLVVPEVIELEEIALAVPLADSKIVEPNIPEVVPQDLVPEVFVEVVPIAPQDFLLTEDDFALTEENPLDAFSTSGGFGDAISPSDVFEADVVSLAPDTISAEAVVDAPPDPVVIEEVVIDQAPDPVPSEDVVTSEQIVAGTPALDPETIEDDSSLPETVSAPEIAEQQLALLAPEVTAPTRLAEPQSEMTSQDISPKEAVEPEVKRRPVIANPSPQMKGLGQLIRQIRAVPQQQCSLLLPRRSGSAGLGLAMIGVDDVALNAAADRVTSRVDADVARDLDIVDQRQCAVLDALRQSQSYPASRIGLAIENTSLKSGESLKARVLGAGGLNVVLLLVDDNGVVQDLTRFATLDGDVVVIDAPVARSGAPRSTLQMLVVLGSRSGGFALANQMGELAQDVFQSLPAEVLQASVFGMATFQVE